MNKHTFLLRQLDINKSGWGHCLVDLENIKKELSQEKASKIHLQKELNLIKTNLCGACKNTVSQEYQE